MKPPAYLKLSRPEREYYDILKGNKSKLAFLILRIVFGKVEIVEAVGTNHRLVPTTTLAVPNNRSR